MGNDIELTHHQRMRRKSAQEPEIQKASPVQTSEDFAKPVPPNNPGDTYVGIKTGVVKIFREAQGFGFVLDSNNQDHFVHYTDIDAKGFRNLAKGQHVVFHAFVGSNGLYAKKVRVANV